MGLLPPTGPVVGPRGRAGDAGAGAVGVPGEVGQVAAVRVAGAPGLRRAAVRRGGAARLARHRTGVARSGSIGGAAPLRRARLARREPVARLLLRGRCALAVTRRSRPRSRRGRGLGCRDRRGGRVRGGGSRVHVAHGRAHHYGGMGRDPGMLIRIRVVSVVSVLRSSGTGRPSAGCPASPGAPSPDPAPWAGVPYGGVPEGYAAPPRPWGPEDELSVSRLKAGSPGWLRRPSRPHAGCSAARTTILAAAGTHPVTADEIRTGHGPKWYVTSQVGRRVGVVAAANPGWRTSQRRPSRREGTDRSRFPRRRGSRPRAWST